MSDSSAGIIRIHTWPQQWQYWPMYVALARTASNFESEFPGFNFEFIVRPKATDADIRESFNRDLEAHIPAMALCEPPLSVDKSPKRTRKIPLIMRMPLWIQRSLRSLADEEQHNQIQKFSERFTPAALLAKADVIRSLLKDNNNIYGFPEHTTSGNYFRKIYKKLQEGMDDDLSPEDVFKVGEEEIVRRMCNGAPDSLFTFSPWHIVEHEIVAIAEFPGPIRDITALMIPDSFKNTDKDTEQNTEQIPSAENIPRIPSAASIYDEVHKQLQRSLKQLFGTDGFDDEMDRVILDWKGEIEKTAWPITNTSGFNGDYLSRFLAHYVRRGCYFPYPLILQSIGGEIERVVEFQLKSLQEDTRNAVSKELQRLFGSDRLWTQLKFSERKECQYDYEGKEDKNEPLWSRLKHLRDSPLRWKKYIDLVYSSKIGGQGSSVFYTVNKLVDNPGANLRCPDEARNSGTDTSIPNCSQHDCVVCQLAGYSNRILQKGKKFLEREFSKKFAKQLSQHDSQIPLCITTVDNFPSLLCWDDVKLLFEVFADELRAPTDDLNAVLYVTCTCDSSKSDSLLNDVLVGIFWRGAVNEKIGKNSATRQFKSWGDKSQSSKENLDIANRPTWVGFGFHENEERAKKLKDLQLGEVGEWILASILPDANPATINAVENLFKNIPEKDSYKFAYLAYFQLNEGDK